MSESPFGVIDVGTNSTNLLIVDAHGTDIIRTITSTRLGEGLHTSGKISDAGLQRTIDTIAQYQEVMGTYNVTHVHTVGTAACRRATNTSDLARALLSRTGLVLDVLSEQQEASMSFSGALVGLTQELTPTLVIDIGGGSTEYTVGIMHSDLSASIPYGAVTSTESHIMSDPPRPEDLTNLIGAVADDLEELMRTMPTLVAPGRVVGVAGTIVTIAAIELGLATFNESALHGMTLTRTAAEDVFRTVATEPLADRIKNPGLSADRVDIIVAGCCILVATMRRLQLDAITVSTRGLSDGVALRDRLLP